MSQFHKGESFDKYNMLRKKETANSNDRNKLFQIIKDSYTFENSFVSGF